MSPHSIEGYLLCKKLYKAESDTPPSLCKMAEGRKKRFFAGEVLEAIFADRDSNDEDFDCGSDIENVPDSENEEYSDIDVSEQLESLQIEIPQGPPPLDTETGTAVLCNY